MTFSREAGVLASGPQHCLPCPASPDCARQAQKALQEPEGEESPELGKQGAQPWEGAGWQRWCRGRCRAEGRVGGGTGLRGRPRRQTCLTSFWLHFLPWVSGRLVPLSGPQFPRL